MELCDFCTRTCKLRTACAAAAGTSASADAYTALLMTFSIRNQRFRKRHDFLVVMLMHHHDIVVGMLMHHHDIVVDMLMHHYDIVVGILIHNIVVGMLMVTTTSL